VIEGAPPHDVGGESGSVLTADVIASAVGGRLIGDPTVSVTGIAPLDRARPEDVSFLATPKYAGLFAASQAGVVLVAPALADAAGTVRTRIVVEQPHEALLSLIHRFYQEPRRTPGVHATATIGRGARLGRDVSVGAFAVIGSKATIGDAVSVGAHCVIGDRVSIGDGCQLHPNVTLYAGTRLGRRVIVHSGARLGSDGFGYVYRQGRHEKIPHVGGCIVEDDVEIGANTTVDRGSIDDTVIGAGTKIDNLVHIAHNVRVGRLCLIMAQVGIAGSTRVEDGCVLAGQVGVGGHVTIGAGAKVGGQAGVFGDVPAGASWSGYPARPHKEALRAQAALFKMPALLRRIEQLFDARDRETKPDEGR
jgi:UDP-3-O-[3-hydroxymyristoyl] glucosamine N-acyltransferase